MADYDLHKTTLTPASGSACDGRLTTGAVCLRPAVMRLALSGCSHPLCVDHATKAAAWITSKVAESGARIHCSAHGTYTSVAKAARVYVSALGS